MGRARCLALAALVAGLLGAGCQRSWCVEGLDLERTYRTTVLDRALPDSAYGVQGKNGADFGMSLGGSTCGADFDLVPGSAFSITPVSKIDTIDCDGRLGVVSGVTEVELAEELSFPVRANPELMRTPVYRARRGDACVGAWQTSYLSPRHGPPVGTPAPGTYPSVLLHRYFDATVGSCVAEFGGGPVGCDDYFVIALEPI